MPDLVLVVGARRAALEAAQRLGLEAALLADVGTPRRFERHPGGFAEVSFEAEPAVLEAAARRLLGERRPRAVAPVTERAVIPAAVLAAALGLPGLAPEDARVLRDKVAMKERLRAAGIPCARARPVESGKEGVALAEEIGYPVVVKARSSSGSRGTVIARHPQEVSRAVAAIRRTAGSGGAALERFVAGRELSVEAFSADGRVRWMQLTEYLRPGWSNLLPARLEEGLAGEARKLVRKALAACSLRWGMTHTELFLSEDGLRIGEINARPPGGGLMELIERLYGFDSWGEALRHQMATVPRKKLPDSARGAAGNVFLHPGAGVVEKVEGWEEVLRLPGVVEARLRLKPGDRISPRLGTGQTRGWVTVEGDDAEIVAATLAEVESRLRVTLR